MDMMGINKFVSACLEAQGKAASLGDSEMRNLIIQYQGRVQGQQWTAEQGFDALDALIVKALPRLRYLNIPCNSVDDLESTTDYTFTTYDKTKVAYGWLSVDELKAWEDSDGDPDSPSPAFKRYNPVDWAQEEAREFRFLACMSDLAQRNEMGEAILLMDKFIRYKATKHNQWCTFVPSFCEVNQTGRLKGYASFNGRYNYACARAGIGGIYFYITNSMVPKFSGPDGKLIRSVDAGRNTIEPYPIGHKVGDPPVLTTLPLGLVEPPETLAQQIMSAVQVAATFIVQFVNALYSIATFGQSVDSVVKTVVGMISSPDHTPKMVENMQSTVAATEAVYYQSKQDNLLQNSYENIIFAEGFASQYAKAEDTALTGSGFAKLDVAPVAIVSSAPVGWANRLFAR